MSEELGRRRVCDWCGKPATTSVLVLPAETVVKNGRRHVRKPGVWANVCDEHRRHAYDPYAAQLEAASAAKNERLRLVEDKKMQTTIDDFLT